MTLRLYFLLLITGVCVGCYEERQPYTGGPAQPPPMNPIGNNTNFTDAGVPVTNGTDSGVSGIDHSEGTDAGSDENDFTGRLPDGGIDCSQPLDWDNDGFVDHRCGGDDCDDENASIHPNASERCDYLDNNCNDAVNDGIECWFYAHGPNTLYKVDPFLFTTENLGTVPSLFDFDTAPAPDNRLYGVRSNGKIMRYNEDSETWEYIDFSQSSIGGNGFAIDLYGTGYITSGSKLYEVDINAGVTTQEWVIGTTELPVNSSGDCVVNKDNSFFMTSRNGGTDELIYVDSITREAVLVGDTGYGQIYGLTAAWGNLYGLTSSGYLLQIDEQTGAGTLLYDFPVTFYGAASSPSR